ncbi:ribosomal L7Ae/L30e/S12e/Gadd45 family protein [Candidatus Woesearchaeota archaeon]|nr:ribosomal L7Ae/L30e/S12e/Gadd45 family protein [Candidatus Woesearchaeota archaeon]
MATQTEKALDEIRKLLKTKKLVIGTERTLKGLRAGKVARVFYAANCAAPVKSDIMHFSKLTAVEPVELEVDNRELGVMCKKPFSISVLSIAKD